MVVDLVTVGVVALCLCWCCWLANDLLWERWEAETDKAKARQLTWLIALNLAGVVIGGLGLLLLAFRTSIW